MPEKESNRGQLKRWVLALLIASCAAVGLLHVTEAPENQVFLTHSGQADSLITVTLQKSGIADSLYRTRQIVIDSLRTRREYIVDLPAGISPTYWHIRLNEEVSPYGIQTPAKVQFPEMDLRIHLTFGTNVIRTVILQPDNETD